MNGTRHFERVAVEQVLRLYCCCIQGARMLNATDLQWADVRKFYGGPRMHYVEQLVSVLPDDDGAPRVEEPDLYVNQFFLKRIFTVTTACLRRYCWLRRDHAAYIRRKLLDLIRYVKSEKPPPLMDTLDRRLRFRSDLWRAAGMLGDCCGRWRLFSEVAGRVEYLGAESFEGATLSVEDAVANR